MVEDARFCHLSFHTSSAHGVTVQSFGRKGDTTAVLEVKASNQGALSLYSKLDFDEVGRRRRYYPNGEDALLLQKSL